MRRFAAWGVAIAALLGGCAAPGPGLPDGVSATVFETRFDAALRQVQLRVVNDSDAAIRVLTASLESALYLEPAIFDRPQSIPAGSARDLPVPLGEAQCDPAGGESSIILEFETPTGTGFATIALGSPAILATAHERDCLVAAVERLATIAPPTTVEWTPGAGEPAVLEFAVIPTGEPGILTISSVGATTLLGVVDEDGNRATPVAVGLLVDEESGASTIRVRIEPARCDPHAIAEDKQGTHFPFAVDADGRSGEIRIVASAGVRAEIYRYVTDYCGA